jgi:hypothetical protein
MVLLIGLPAEIPLQSSLYLLSALQLRQTGIHGGVHNHITLPASDTFVPYTIYFSSFKGGLTTLDLSNVAKFNFALLGNNSKQGYAELIVRSFRIHRYKP